MSTIPVLLDWVGTDVAASRLGISRARVRQLVDEGKLEARRVAGTGHRVLVSEQAIETRLQALQS